MSEPGGFPPPVSPGGDDPDDATPFDDVDVGDGTPPAQDESLPDDEKSAITKERDDIIASNGGRSADEQISVDPLEVN